MKIKKVLLGILIITLVFGMAGCSEDSTSVDVVSEEDYSYDWKIATTETSDYYMTILAQEFIDLVSERTDGKVTGKIFPSGQLGGLMDVLEGLELGNVDIVLDGLSTLGADNKLFDAWGMPYLYDDKEHQYRFWDNSFEECAELVAKESNIRMVTVIDGLNRQLSSKVPVNDIEDIKGLKIRVPTIPAYLRIWELFGAAPVPMDFGEVYTAIQTGVVEGQENDIPLTMSMNFYEVSPYAVITDHVAYEGSLYFDEATYQSYPKELRDIIDEVGQEIMEKSRSMIGDIEKEAMKKLDEMNVTVIRPDLEPFKEATKEMYSEYSYVEPIINMVNDARK